MTTANDNQLIPSTPNPAPMSRDWTSAAEDAATIRAALKSGHGWNSRKVSVKSDSYSMGSSITVTILAAGISKAVVAEIANRHDHVRRCEVSGDILGGGNRYVTVRFDDALISAVGAEFTPWLEALPITDSSLSSLTVAGREYHIGRRNAWEYQCFGPEGHENARDAASVRYVLAVAKLEAGLV